MRAAGRRGRRGVLARIRPAILHVPASREYAEGNRLPVQPDSVGVPIVPDERGCVRVLLQEPSEREAAPLGYGRVPSLPEAPREGFLRDAQNQPRDRLLRAVMGDVFLHHVRGKP